MRVLAVTCYLHFWQNDRDFLRATVVTRGWNGYRNKSQHRKSTLEKKILPPFQQGFEPATFQSRVRCSNHWAIPAPRLVGCWWSTLYSILSETCFVVCFQTHRDMLSKRPFLGLLAHSETCFVVCFQTHRDTLSKRPFLGLLAHSETCFVVCFQTHRDTLSKRPFLGLLAHILHNSWRDTFQLHNGRDHLRAETPTMLYLSYALLS